MAFVACAVFQLSPSSDLYKITDSSSLELFLLFRVPTCLYLPVIRKQRAPSLGFPSPSRHQYEESTCRQIYQPCLRSTLSVSRALDGFLLLTPCRLVSSRCHVRDFSSRVSPANQPSWVSPAVPSCRWRRTATLRLQGFDPIADPLRLLEVLPPSSLLDPFLSFGSFGFSSEHLDRAFSRSPLMTFFVDPSL